MTFGIVMVGIMATFKQRRVAVVGVIDNSRHKLINIKDEW